MMSQKEATEKQGLRKEKKAVDLTEGAILPKLIRFCIPLMLVGMLQLLYNLADTFVVGQFDTPDAVGAVTSCGSLIGLLVNLFIGLSVGVSVTVAQAVGAKQDREVSAIIHTSLTMGAIIGVIVGVLGFVFTEDALRLMKAPAEILPKAAPYMQAYMVGIPAAIIYNYCAAALRAKGDSTRPMIFLAVSGVINVIMNLVMVIVFRMGALGVGIATTISQYVAMLMILAYMTFFVKDSCRIRWNQLQIDGGKMKKILAVGLPAGFQSVLFSFSNVLIQSAVNTFGNAVVNGNGAAASIDGFIYNAMNSVYHGAITFVGQHVGARKYDRLNRVMLDCMGLVTVIGLAVGAIVVLFSRPFLNVLIPGDEAAIAWGQERLVIIGWTYFLCGLMEVGSGSLRGMGRPIMPMLISLAGSCLLRIVWIYTIFQWEHTMFCLYLSYPVSWFVTAVVELALAFVVKGKLIRQEREGNEEAAVSVIAGDPVPLAETDGRDNCEG